MGSTADLRPGAVVKYNGDNCVVLESEHRTPGNLRAFYQVKMRNLKSGKLSENRFRSGESIDFVRVERKNYQYLYRDGHQLIFMDYETYEQFPVDDVLLGESVQFLKENDEAQLAFEGSHIIAVDMPPHVNLRVVHTEPGVRGDTATNVLKPATLETGAIVNVPIFINEDDVIRVDARTGAYVERIKN